MAPSNRRRRISWALAGSCVMPLALACNGVIGLSDYRRGECSGGGVCSDAGPLFDGTVADSPVDGDRPDVTTDASGTRPVSWAAWPMPNYDAGAPIDNAPMAYDVVVSQGFQDRITKLVWRHPMPPEAANATYAKALEICASPWRLPSRIELVTLLDMGQNGAKIAPVFKAPDPGTPQGVHWTFSEVRPFGEDGRREHWVVDFGVGGVAKRDENGGQAAVRCVKGGS